MVAINEIAQRQSAPRPHSVGAVPHRIPRNKSALPAAKPVLKKLPTDEELKKETTPIQRCASEVVIRPGTAPGSCSESLNVNWNVQI